MRRPMVGLAGFLLLGLGGLAAWSLTQAQDRSQPAQQPSSNPPATTSREKAAAETLVPASVAPARDPSKLTPLQEQMDLNARRGADWLFRMNWPDGRFVPGYSPALKTAMEGDHFLRQAQAAFALARAARYTGEQRYAARATLAVLTLLGQTVAD